MTALLEVKGLTTKVSGFTILNKLDFSIEENELRVLLGPNGAGFRVRSNVGAISWNLVDARSIQ
jgi:ABC-type uncharacterized transport system ATPase subunit